MVAEYDLQALLQDAENLTKLILHDAFRRGFPKMQIDSQTQKLDQLKKSLKRIKSQVSIDYDFLSKAELKIKEFSLGREEIDKYIQTLDIFRPSINFDDSELDNVKSQVSAILQMSLDNDALQRKLTELSAAVQLDRKDATFIDQLVDLIASHTSKVAELEVTSATIAQRDAQLAAALEKYDLDILELQSKYQEKTDDLRKRLRESDSTIDEMNLKKDRREEEFKGIVAQMNSEYERKMTELNQQHQRKILELKETHNFALEQERKEHNDDIARLNSNFERKLEESNANKNVEIDELNQAHEKKITDLNQAHATQIVELQATHNKQIRDLEQKHKEFFNREKADLENVISNLESQLQKTEQKQPEQEKSGNKSAPVQEKIAETIGTQTDDLENELKKVETKTEVELKNLRDKLELFDKFKNEIVKILKEDDSSYELKESDLSRQLLEISNDVTNISKLKSRIKTSLDEANKTIQMNLDKFEEEKNKLQEANQKLSVENNRLQQELNQSGDENAKLKSQLDEASQQLQSLQRQNQELNATTQRLTMKQTNFDSQINELRLNHAQELGKMRELLAETNVLTNTSKNNVLNLLDAWVKNSPSILNKSEISRIESFIQNIKDDEKTPNSTYIKSIPEIIGAMINISINSRRLELVKSASESKNVDENTLEALQNELTAIKLESEKLRSLILQLGKTVVSKDEKDPETVVLAIAQKMLNQQKAIKEQETVIKDMANQLSKIVNSIAQQKNQDDQEKKKYEEMMTKILSDVNTNLRKLSTENESLKLQLATQNNQPSPNINLQQIIDDQAKQIEDQKKQIDNLIDQNAGLKKIIDDSEDIAHNFEKLREDLRKLNVELQESENARIDFETKSEQRIKKLKTEYKRLKDGIFGFNQDLNDFKEYCESIVSKYNKAIVNSLNKVLDNIDKLPEQEKLIIRGRIRDLVKDSFDDSFNIQMDKVNPKENRYKEISLNNLGDVPVYKDLPVRLQDNELVTGGAQVKNQVSQQELHKLNQLVKFVKSKLETKVPSVVLKCNELEKLIKKASSKKLDPKTKKELMKVYEDLKMELVLLEIATSRHPHEIIKDLYRQKKISNSQLNKFEQILSKKVGGGAPVDNSVQDMVIYIIIAIVIILALILIYYWISYVMYNDKINPEKVEYAY